MRFRILSDNELKLLEEEFKQFLIVNQMHSEEWIELNKSFPEKALALVEVFSDTVLLKVYGQIKFLEFRNNSVFSIYKISDKNIQALHVKCENPSLSILTDDELALALSKKLDELTIYKAEKQVSPFKEDEIHKLIQQGCIISNELIWNQMNEVLNGLS